MFFFDKCQVVKVVLDDLTEAFQFFDSQNARGKDLEPHDLLKAFHLREMSHLSDSVKIDIVKKWEEIDSDKLTLLFSQYLYRIRNWSKGTSARYFTKDSIGVFKGINPDSKDIAPYAKTFNIVHHYVDNYNADYNRNIDHNTMDYPFQIDQLILNGKRFFEMISYYNKINTFYDKKNEIMNIINTYDGRNRTGDKYVRTLFDCALMYYIDKFGEIEIDRAIEKLFIWAYSLRLKRQSVQLASVDNYALDNVQMFKTIREAVSHKEVINIKVDNLEEINSTKTEAIKTLFENLKYYKESKS